MHVRRNLVRQKQDGATYSAAVNQLGFGSAIARSHETPLVAYDSRRWHDGAGKPELIHSCTVHTSPCFCCKRHFVAHVNTLLHVAAGRTAVKISLQYKN